MSEDAGVALSPRPGLGRDVRLLFTARIARLFAYGLVSVVLVLYLSAVGLTTREAGALLSLTLLGDTVITLWLTTAADRLGRRRMLLVGAGLMLFAGAVFTGSHTFWVLLVAATLGVISPSGNEIGPFLSIEQASLSQVLTAERRTHVFAWYNLVGSCATAAGALVGGGVAGGLQAHGYAPVASYRALVAVYAGFGLVLGLLFAWLTPRIEASAPGAAPAAAGPGTRFGLHRSRGIVSRLAALFALDAFGGGFVLQSIMAYWFHLRFGTPPAVLGAIFFGANLLAGASALLASRLAARIGLINTMVFTHVPSNLLLMLVPFMPTQALAIALLLVRFSISQMDVPTRQSYVMAVVSPDERSAAGGVTAVARSIGASAAPSVAGLFLGSVTLATIPFVLAGALKITYDLLLYRSFRAVPPEGEASREE